MPDLGYKLDVFLQLDGWFRSMFLISQLVDFSGCRWGRWGGQLPPTPWIFCQGISQGILTAISCSHCSCQLQSKMSILSPLKLKMSTFSRDRARTVTKTVFEAGAREKWSIFFFYFFIAFTCIMQS